MNRILAELIAQYALFPGPTRLRQLGSSERVQFLDLLRRVADETTGEEREIVLRLPEDVGLA
jgi:hypothetical protein